MEHNKNIIHTMRPEVQRARELRRNMSEPEVMLWSRLRRLRDRGFHIRRQAPFRGYYLDFVCHARRLAIEVDGFQHGDDAQAAHDAVRDRILARHGYRVLRFWSGEVRRDLTAVMDQIIRALEEAPTAHDFPPLDGEGQAAEPPGWGSVGRSAESALERDFPTRPQLRLGHPPH